MSKEGLLKINGYGPEGAYFEAQSAYEFDRKVEEWAREYKSDVGLPVVLTTVRSAQEGGPSWTFNLYPMVTLGGDAGGAHLGRGLVFERRYCISRENDASAVRSQHRRNRRAVETILWLLFANRQVDHEYMSQNSCYLTEEERNFLSTCHFPREQQPSEEN